MNNRKFDLLLDNQINNQAQLSKVLINIKKLSKEKRTPDVLAKELERGRGFWTTFRQNHQTLLTTLKKYWKGTEYESNAALVRQEFIELREFVRNLAPEAVTAEDESDELVLDPKPNPPDNEDKDKEEEEEQKEEETDDDDEDPPKPNTGKKSKSKKKSKTSKSVDTNEVLRLLAKSTNLLLAKSLKEYKEKPRSLHPPELGLQPFSGIMKEYRVFKATFLSTVKRYEMSTWDKINLLQSKLTGEAKEEIASLEIREENYTIAWHLLDQRYENRRSQISDLLNEINSFPAFRKNNYETVKKYARVAKGIANNAESMGITANEFLMYILLRPVAPTLRGKFIEQTKCGGEMPTAKQYTDFLVYEEELLRQYEDLNPQSQGLSSQDDRNHQR